jgi:hypothetical protein
MNYRAAVKQAVHSGYRGAFCTEHYGGDGLSVSARNRDYLRGLLSQALLSPARASISAGHEGGRR